jgi:hypothetical protein
VFPFSKLSSSSAGTSASSSYLSFFCFVSTTALMTMQHKALLLRLVLL